MIQWLIPFALFPTLAALYYGGAPIRFEGAPDGPRQLLGLLVGLVMFVVLWGLLRAVAQPMTGQLIGLALASVFAVMLLRPTCWLAYRVVGIRIVPDDHIPSR